MSIIHRLDTEFGPGRPHPRVVLGYDEVRGPSLYWFTLSSSSPENTLYPHPRVTVLTS